MTAFEDDLCTSPIVKQFGLPVRRLQKTLPDGNISSLSEERLATCLTITISGVEDMEPKQGHGPELAAKPLQITWVPVWYSGLRGEGLSGSGVLSDLVCLLFLHEQLPKHEYELRE